MKQSDKQKGNAIELKFKQVLLNWGYVDQQIERARPTYKHIFVRGKSMIISSQNDFYSLFDFIVKTEYTTFYYQVKSNPQNASAAKKEIIDFIAKYGMETDTFAIVQNVLCKGFILRPLTDLGEQEKKYINFKGVTLDSFTQS